MKLGKAKYSGERKEVHKIKDGDNIFRILPPMGKLADAGVFSRYFRVCWGYKGSDGRLKPFVSPRVQNWKSKMIEVDCAAFNRVQRLKEEMESKTKQAKALAHSGTAIPEDLKKRLGELTELVGKKGRFNIDSKHHLNAMSKEGKIGLLKLAGRGMAALKTEFKALEAAGIDATGVEGGRFMNIQRSGTGLDTAYAAKELKEQVQTEEYGLVERPMPHNLTDSIVSRLAAEAYELDEIYPAPSEAEVKEIVEAYERSESEGALVVDRILGTPAPVANNEAAPVTNNTVAETKVEQRAEAVTEAPVTNVTETVNTETGEVNETPTAVAQPVEVTQPVATETPAAEATPVANNAAQSDADFLADLGVNLG